MEKRKYLQMKRFVSFFLSVIMIFSCLNMGTISVKAEGKQELWQKVLEKFEKGDYSIDGNPQNGTLVVAEEGLIKVDLNYLINFGSTLTTDGDKFILQYCLSNETRKFVFNEDGTITDICVSSDFSWEYNYKKTHKHTSVFGVTTNDTENDTLTGYCVSDDCYLKNISSDDPAIFWLYPKYVAYKGQEISKSDVFNEDDLKSFCKYTGADLTIDDIVIYAADDETKTSISTINSAGDYCAELTVDNDKTAKTSFTVEAQLTKDTILGLLEKGVYCLNGKYDKNEKFIVNDDGFYFYANSSTVDILDDCRLIFFNSEAGLLLKCNISNSETSIQIYEGNIYIVAGYHFDGAFGEFKKTHVHSCVFYVKSNEYEDDTIACYCGDVSCYDDEVQLKFEVNTQEYGGEEITKSDLFSEMDFNTFNNFTDLDLSVKSINLYAADDADKTSLSGINKEGDYIAELTVNNDKTARISFTINKKTTWEDVLEYFETGDYYVDGKYGNGYLQVRSDGFYETSGDKSYRLNDSLAEFNCYNGVISLILPSETDYSIEYEFRKDGTIKRLFQSDFKTNSVIYKQLHKHSGHFGIAATNTFNYDTVTWYCDADGCDLPYSKESPLKLTIVSDNPTYMKNGEPGWHPGEEVSIKIDGPEGWESLFEGDSLPRLVYTNTDKNYYYDTVAPTNEGKYCVYLLNEYTYAGYNFWIGHVYDKQVADSEKYLYKDATCEEAAEYYHSCKCGKSEENADNVFESGEPTGHSWEYSVTENGVEATCKNDSNHKASVSFTTEDLIFKGSLPDDPASLVDISEWSGNYTGLADFEVCYVKDRDYSSNDFALSEAPDEIGTYYLLVYLKDKNGNLIKFANNYNSIAAFEKEIKIIANETYSEDINLTVTGFEPGNTIADLEISGYDEEVMGMAEDVIIVVYNCDTSELLEKDDKIDDNCQYDVYFYLKTKGNIAFAHDTYDVQYLGDVIVNGRKLNVSYTCEEPGEYTNGEYKEEVLNNRTFLRINYFVTLHSHGDWEVIGCQGSELSFSCGNKNCSFEPGTALVTLKIKVDTDNRIATLEGLSEVNEILDKPCSEDDILYYVADEKGGFDSDKCVGSEYPTEVGTYCAVLETEYGSIYCSFEVDTPEVTVAYSSLVQDNGWEKASATNGQLSGTSGQAKRIEAVKISVTGNDKLGIQYTTHCQSYGWRNWSANGEVSGTEDEGKRFEAIKIQLTGEDKDYYDVYYRVHSQSFGWMGWAKNGEPAGTANQAKRVEAIQIVVLRKGESLDENMGGIVSKTKLAYSTTTADKTVSVPGADVAHVEYRTHVQTYGMQKYVSDGAVSGTSGEAKRLEGIYINLKNKDCEGGIVYNTHVQTFGWQGKTNDMSTWKKDGELSGTEGLAKRLEAIQIALTGEMAEKYDVYYRVHSQTYGWLGWAKNGEIAGTSGLAKRLEGIQIVLVKKGDPAPGKLYNGIEARTTSAYIQK